VLTETDLRQAFAVAADWHRADDVTELAELAVQTLHELVPCDGVGWNEVDVQQHAVRAVTSPPGYLGPELAAQLDRLVDQHPIVAYVGATGDTRTHKISDFVSARAFHSLEIYADFFRPLGAEDLAAMIVEPGETIVGIAFTRDRRSYTKRDLVLLDVVRPHLAAAYRNVVTRGEARSRLDAFERGLPGKEVVALERNGRPAFRSKLLESWFGGDVPDAGTYERDDARLLVRVVDGEPPLLLLEETRLAPDPERVRALGLTARQAEILGLVARGFTDGEIAAELYLSVRTVEKHLEHAFARLDVHSRNDAVRVLFA